jgi:hypothetical protein
MAQPTVANKEIGRKKIEYTKNLEITSLPVSIAIAIRLDRKRNGDAHSVARKKQPIPLMRSENCLSRSLGITNLAAKEPYFRCDE